MLFLLLRCYVAKWFVYYCNNDGAHSKYIVPVPSSKRITWWSLRAISSWKQHKKIYQISRLVNLCSSLNVVRRHIWWKLNVLFTWNLTPKVLRGSLRGATRIFWESKISDEKSIFFLFRHNIPFCELVSKNIFLSSSDSFSGWNLKKFENPSLEITFCLGS